MKLTKLILTAFAVCSAFSGMAKVKLPALLCDNAVLQRNQTVVLWGEATPNQKVKIQTSWNSKSYTAKSSKDGKFELEVSTSEAGGPYTITFDDGDKTTISNIMLGEVWLCSGQSNMEQPMAGFPDQPVLGATDAILKAKKSTPIRTFTVERAAETTPQTDFKGSWNEHTPTAVAQFSAAGYFFAKYINECLDIPVGVINSSWGGSKIEAWMSRETLEGFKEYDFSAVDKGEVVVPALNPIYLYNGMIYPLKNYKFKGMLWYQGESNRDNHIEYETLLPLFVKHLRNELFDCGNFPFYYAEVAPLGWGKAANVLLRESMGRVMDNLDNCGMIPLTDIGEKGSIHPRFKKEVGERMAYWALAECYGIKGVDYKAPTFDRVFEVEATKQRPAALAVVFKNVGKGVCFSNVEARSDNFEIAGEDKVFYPAQIQFYRQNGARLLVYSDKVSKPVAVRYAFKGYVIGDLFNVDGVALSSFRSDDWEVIEK